VWNLSAARAFQPESGPLRLAACRLLLRGGRARCWAHAKPRSREEKRRLPLCRGVEHEHEHKARARAGARKRSRDREGAGMGAA